MTEHAEANSRFQINFLMNITIRDTAETDLAAIFLIRADPLVVPHQYRLSARDKPEIWKQLLFGVNGDGNSRFKCTTVLNGDEVIGHISQQHVKISDQAVCQCGWNLAPTYWGRGVMVVALTQLFDDFFGEQRIDFVVADCFWNNRRCIRLMDKLKFRPINIRLLHRAQIAFAMGCFRWIRRFQLSATEWRNRSAL